MKSSSISVSNAMLLSTREWIITVVSVAVLCGVIYYGWNSWETFEPGPDHRENCWAARQSDYWAYNRWIKYAKDNYDFLLMGDSVIWGQEVRNDETISHYLNHYYGDDVFANMGNDGLFMAGIGGIVEHYGENLDNTNVVVQLSPLWMASLRRDLRGEKKSRYHHPRLIPQFSSRINYYHDLNTRIGYFIEHYFRLFPFIRHLMANYYDNKSIASWMIDNPYKCPFSAITFKSSPVMDESQGKSIDWESKNYKQSGDPFVEPSESIQWECYRQALRGLQKKNSRVFVLIGPYNHHMHKPESRQRLFTMIEKLKKELDDMGIPYYDSFSIGLPSRTFGDSCHLLKDGHAILARSMLEDDLFRQWMSEAE